MKQYYLRLCKNVEKRKYEGTMGWISQRHPYFLELFDEQLEIRLAGPVGFHSYCHSVKRKDLDLTSCYVRTSEKTAAIG